MKVLELTCSGGHRFEGWFGSDEDFESQRARALVACPICAETAVSKLPSAPRLNLSGARSEPHALSVKPGVADLQGAWMQALRQVLRNTEDVGERFPEEARRIHYGEAAERGIRGQATRDEAAALADEGIEVMQLPLPDALKGPLQ